MKISDYGFSFRIQGSVEWWPICDLKSWLITRATKELTLAKHGMIIGTIRQEYKWRLYDSWPTGDRTKPFIEKACKEFLDMFPEVLLA